MRVNGLNLLAILVAAIAIYAVGFVLYGLVLTPEQWIAASGIDKAKLDAIGMARMPYSPVMPIVTAIGMAVLFKCASVQGLAEGVKWGGLVACLSALPALWYGWVYGVGPAAGTLIDSGHLLVGHGLAGAILGSWK